MFVYYNANPSKKHTGDCVVRAISVATNIPYKIIENKLYYTGKLLECDPLCLNCYTFLLDKYFNFPKVYAKGLTIKEFADIHSKGIYLVRVKGHLSVVYDSRIIDIWDCSDEIITDAWQTGE